eukprot:TRINITY_DN173_c0_g1_i2.p1 TRINITY_DN173_c0_g1~~TRINITY_DN173_c0_g1_i2.p1  ORF type:complete len:470 (-),score=68.90 TRINITY_DN173_c0_g1_i2:421-1809(-)
MGTCLHIFLLLLVVITSDLANGQIRFGTGERGRLESTFRPQQRPRQRPRQRLTATPCPNGQVFCENVPDYPMNIVSRYGNFSEQLFSQDFTPRSFQFEEEVRACDVKRTVVFPRKAKSTDGDFKFVLNSKDFPQAIETETCYDEGKTCGLDDDAPTKGSTICRQLYATYQLIALDKDGGEVEDYFNLPSACICHHQDKQQDFLRRFPVKQLELPPLCDDKSLRIANFDSENEVNTGRKQQPRPRKDTNSVNFPGDTQPTRRPIRRPSRRPTRRPTARPFRKFAPPTGCAESGGLMNHYCETSPSYPKRDIELSVKNAPKKIKRPFLMQSCINPQDVIGQRISTFNENKLCEGRSKIIAPKEALNKNNTWRYIANIEGFLQTISVEECSIGFGSCKYSGVDGNAPEQTECRQVYRTHKLLILNDFGELEADEFDFPSACACFYRRDFNFGLQLRFKGGRRGGK